MDEITIEAEINGDRTEEENKAGWKREGKRGR
jgi:hypothetical protein